MLTLTAPRVSSASALIPLSSSRPLPADQLHDAGLHENACRETAESQQTGNSQASVDAAIRELLETLPQAATEEAWIAVERCIQVAVGSSVACTYSSLLQHACVETSQSLGGKGWLCCTGAGDLAWQTGRPLIAQPADPGGAGRRAQGGSGTQPGSACGGSAGVWFEG